MCKRGHEKIIAWQNSCELRQLIYQITSRFSHAEMRRVSQMRDAARSVKQNIQEGYNSGFLGKYIHGVAISQGSLSELVGDVSDCFQDKLISEEEFNRLKSLLGRTEYLLKRLRQSLKKKQIEGTWINYYEVSDAKTK